MRKPFENKKAYDPGRLRHRINFFEEQGLDNGSGGTTVNEIILLTTFAGKEKINQYNQLALQAGASVFNGDTYFVIRNRKEFYPEKDMKIKFESENYVIHGVVELDDPCTFLQLLCVRSR